MSAKNRITIRITKALLDGYRSYKIDQATKDIEEVFYYTALTHLMKLNTLPELYEKLGDSSAIIVNVEDNYLIKREATLITDKQFVRYKQFIDEEIEKLIKN